MSLGLVRMHPERNAGARLLAGAQRLFRTRQEHAEYLEDVKASPMLPPRDLVRVHDLEAHVPFLHAVDPMASHLIIRKTAPDRAPGTAAASLVEATYPLETDEKLRHSVSDFGKWASFRLGKFFEAVDALTADVAYAHTDGLARGLALVTASHAYSRKLEGTHISKDVVLRVYITKTGSTSLEIRTDSLQYDGGAPTLINYCITTMVAVDRATTRPVPGSVPPLGPPEPEDAARAALRARLAATHADLRRYRAEYSMRLRDPVTHPPQPGEMVALHDLHRKALSARETGARRVKPIKDATYRASFVVFPEHRNVQGTLFGGFVIGQAFNLAYYTARFFARGDWVVPLGLDDATFNAPVKIGDCVTFTARVVHKTAETCRVNVLAEIRDPSSEHHIASKRTNRLVFVFAARCRAILVPQTYSEHLMHIDAARASRDTGPSDVWAAALNPRIRGEDGSGEPPAGMAPSPCDPP
mmetsp:Transcript_7531/g.22310  ORF Transcript_7531/g.22310 Transcript_7531/m.22310 type:complete len:471 (+) Transcript_7531:138-1550(+)